MNSGREMSMLNKKTQKYVRAVQLRVVWLREFQNHARGMIKTVQSELTHIVLSWVLVGKYTNQFKNHMRTWMQDEIPI